MTAYLEIFFSVVNQVVLILMRDIMESGKSEIIVGNI